MNSVRRSSIFDRPQIMTVTLTLDHPLDMDLELQGSRPPVIAQVCEFSVYNYHNLQFTPTANVMVVYTIDL